MPDNDFIMEIKIALARIEEKQTSQALASDHRHNNLRMVIESLATKKEVESVEDKLDLTNKRVESIESNQSRVVWGIIGMFGAILSSLTGLSKKLGF